VSLSGDIDSIESGSSDARGSSSKPITVSELTQRIKDQLEIEFPWVAVIGEISNFKPHSSGHFYFSLKDEGASISAVMFRGSNSALKFRPVDGQRVIGFGKITVYPPRGGYQIVLSRMEPDGLGALQLAFDQLKRKLEAEGLFAKERKRPIPEYPEHIGIVTSPTGAAIRDILNIIDRRFRGVRVSIFPVKVQGDGSAQEVAQAIAEANEFFSEMDVLIVGRGGGSIEDLWAFNEEVVARAIAASSIPVISAVGHEVDFTIADFVADLRAPTPSAAAELAVPSREEALRQVDNLVRRLLQLEKKIEFYGFRIDDLVNRLERSLQRRVSNLKEELSGLRERLQDHSPRMRLKELQHQSFTLSERLRRATETKLSDSKWAVKGLQDKLRLLSPLNIMERGYSIVRVRKSFKIVKKASEVQMGDELLIKFHKGEITAKV
jgi:exodeoxyribonuclease VII large subunit